MFKTSEIRCHACNLRFTSFDFWRRHMAEVHGYVRRDPVKDEMKPKEPYAMRYPSLNTNANEAIAEKIAKKVVQDYFYQLQSELNVFLQGYWDDSTPAVDRVRDAVSFTINNMGGAGLCANT